MKNGIQVTLKISLTLVGDLNDGNNIPHKLSLSNAQVQSFVKPHELI